MDAFFGGERTRYWNSETPDCLHPPPSVHTSFNFQLTNPPHPHFQRTLSLNLTSTFLGIKHSAPYLRKTLVSTPILDPQRPPTGSIIALSSIAGTRYHEHGGSYCVAKAGWVFEVGS